MANAPTVDDPIPKLRQAAVDALEMLVNDDDRPRRLGEVLDHLTNYVLSRARFDITTSVRPTDIPVTFYGEQIHGAIKKLLDAVVVWAREDPATSTGEHAEARLLQEARIYANLNGPVHRAHALVGIEPFTPRDEDNGEKKTS